MDSSPLFLAVDDDPIIQRAIAKAAAGRMQTRMAGSGQAAMEALRSIPLPRFVLLDFMLPDMDGLAVLRHIRADPRYETVPVVMFSSIGNVDKMREAMAAGANSWVRKPDDPAKLREAVHAICTYWGGVHVACEVMTAGPSAR